MAKNATNKVSEGTAIHVLHDGRWQPATVGLLLNDDDFAVLQNGSTVTIRQHSREGEDWKR